MEITLTIADFKDAGVIHGMQVRAFQSLLEKYQDFETSPASEPIEKVIARLQQSVTDYYLIKGNSVTIGGIRIVKLRAKRYRVSPVFVLPEYQGRGIAQRAFQIIEKIYSDAQTWELDTILQEPGNCHLYEKLGYRQTGWTQIVNHRMTLVGYEKQVSH